MATGRYEILFKEVPGGFLFRAPNPWILGPGEHYLTTEAQRAEILAIGRIKRPFLAAILFAAIIIACPLASTFLVYSLSSHADPDGKDIAAIAVLTLASLGSSLLIAARLQFRRLAPILAGLPRTDEKLTLADIRASQTKVMSMKALLVLATLFAGSTIVQALSLAFTLGLKVGGPRHFNIEPSQIVLFFAMLSQGALAAVFFFRAAAKAKLAAARE
jgi:hypothetical protein